MVACHPFNNHPVVCIFRHTNHLIELLAMLCCVYAAVHFSVLHIVTLAADGPYVFGVTYGCEGEFIYSREELV